MKEEMFLDTGKRFTSRGDQCGEKESFRGLRENTATGLQQVEQRETCKEGPGHLTAILSLRGMSAGGHRCSAVSNSLQPQQAPLSIAFSRQEYWSGLSFPSPGDLPNLGTEARSPTL